MLDIPKSFNLKFRSAEAKIYFGELCGKPAVLKERLVTKYRHPVLDSKPTNERLKAEGKGLLKCLSIGVKCPLLYFIDFHSHFLVMEQIEDCLPGRQCIEDILNSRNGQVSKALLNLAAKIGQTIARIHVNGLIHGDLTLSSFLIKEDRIGEISSDDNFDLYLIGFGLSYHSSHVEDKAVDLCSLRRSFLSTDPDSEEIFRYLLWAYMENAPSDGCNVLKELDEIKLRGRKRSSIG